MNRYALSHVDDHALLRDLATHVERNCAATADLLAHLAEVDARRLYVPAAHPSMRSYCVHVLRMSEDAASKRIHVARKAREFPAIFVAVADGRLHLSGAALLAPHMTPGNADDLLTAASHRTKSAIETMLALRFPKQDVPTRITPIPNAATDTLIPEPSASVLTLQHAPGHVEAPYPTVRPLAPERFSIQFTMRQEMFTKLRYAQSLLGHQVSSGDLPEVLERALDALIAKLEKTTFAATDRPRPARPRSSSNPRYVPAHVRRAVNERDGGQCTFMSEDGARCPERSSLEFDHILEVARGGQATIDGMRLRCRAHNQYEAEQTFGAGFMARKRDEAKRVAAEQRAKATPAGERESVTNDDPASASTSFVPGACSTPDPAAARRSQATSL